MIIKYQVSNFNDFTEFDYIIIINDNGREYSASITGKYSNVTTFVDGYQIDCYFIDNKMILAKMQERSQVDGTDVSEDWTVISYYVNNGSVFKSKVETLYGTESPEISSEEKTEMNKVVKKVTEWHDYFIKNRYKLDFK